jgi:hypothetical protein
VHVSVWIILNAFQISAGHKYCVIGTGGKWGGREGWRKIKPSCTSFSMQLLLVHLVWGFKGNPKYFIVNTMLFWHANNLVNYCVLVHENNFVMMSGEDNMDLASAKAHWRAKRSRTLLNLIQKLNMMQCCGGVGGGVGEVRVCTTGIQWSTRGIFVMSQTNKCLLWKLYFIKCE